MKTLLAVTIAALIWMAPTGALALNYHNTLGPGVQVGSCLLRPYLLVPGNTPNVAFVSLEKNGLVLGYANGMQIFHENPVLRTTAIDPALIEANCDVTGVTGFQTIFANLGGNIVVRNVVELGVSFSATPAGGSQTAYQVSMESKPNAALSPVVVIAIGPAGDTAAPVISFPGAPTHINSLDTFTLNVSFDEPTTLVQDQVQAFFGTFANFRMIDSQNYAMEVTPDGTQIVVAVRFWSFRDANGNVGSGGFGAYFDTDAPNVTLSGLPAAPEALSDYTVTAAFSEEVTGVELGDFAVTGANIRNLATSDNITFTATVTPTGGPLSLAFPADAATDLAGNGNMASNVLGADVAVPVDIPALQRETALARSRQLVRSQPNLAQIVFGGGANSANAEVGRASGTFNFSFTEDAPFWLRAQGTWSENGTGISSDYFHAAIGAHRALGEDRYLGVTLQFDRIETEAADGEVTGNGWLLGPYYVARTAPDGLIYDATLLVGRADNQVTPLGLATDDVATDRLLASLGLTGQREYDTFTLRPNLRITYVAERWEAYTNSLAVDIPEQTVEMADIQAGLDFERPIDIGSGTSLLSGGVNLANSQTSGDDDAFSGFSGGLSLGLEHQFTPDSSLSATISHDGLGSDYSSNSVALNYRLRF